MTERSSSTALFKKVASILADHGAISPYLIDKIKKEMMVIYG